MTNLQVQARALGDPTRHRIFELLAASSVPLGVAELATECGVNHNAVRQHLAKLLDAELVAESTAAPSGPGRPRLVYAVHPSTDSRWGVTGPYERLSMLLTEVVRSGATPVEVGRRAGRRQFMGELAGVDPIDPLVAEMAAQGFEPSVHSSGDQVDIVLGSCPYTSAVLTDPSTICELHLGLAQGLAESLDGVVVESLTPKDPRQANCRLRCRRTTGAS